MDATIQDADLPSTIARDSEVATVQTAIDDHIADTADAHDASAISILDTANDFTATDVEGALAELQSDHEADATALSDHIADTGDAHDASAISYAGGTGMSATDVEAAIDELATEKANTGGIVIRIGHTFAIKGTAANGEVPGFFVSLPSGQTAKIVSARYATESGTVTAAVRQNGSGTPDMGALSVTSTAATTDESPDVTLADNDYIDLNLSSASTPVDLRVTVFVEYTV